MVIAARKHTTEYEKQQMKNKEVCSETEARILTDVNFTIFTWKTAAITACMHHALFIPYTSPKG